MSNPISKPSSKERPRLELAVKKATNCDQAEIERTLRTFHPDGHFEIRALDVNFVDDNTRSKIFSADKIPKATRYAADLSGKAKGVYFTLNPVEPKIKAAADDKDIVERQWLGIDTDPVRDADVSSTDAQHEAALTRAREIRTYLMKECGFTDLMLCDSGNGGHINLPISLPNDEASRELCANFLKAIARRFPKDGVKVKVDTGVFNASRIWKVYGTKACKGPNTPDRPHRIARILIVPKKLELITRELLETVINANPATDTGSDNTGDGEPEGFKLLRALDGVPHGERDDQMFRAACSFRASNTTKQVALKLVLDAAARCKPPFPAKRAKEKVERAYKKYPAGKQRPGILYVGGRLPWIVDRAEDVLREGHADYHLYERSRMMMQISLTTRQDKEIKGIKREIGAIVLRLATHAMMIDVLTRAINWLLPKGEDQNGKPKFLPINCPKDVATTILSRVPNLKPLTGVVEAPIMRPDGSILMTPGYDEATGLYLNSSVKWLPVPDHPTRAQVEEAERFLCEPLLEFPFVSGSDLSVTLSAFLTGLQRRLLFSAPLHAFDAPSPSSGKSIQADLVGILVTGYSQCGYQCRRIKRR